MDIPHLSASTIKTFKQCALKLYAIKVLKYKDAPHPLGVMGSALHKGAEVGVKSIIDGDNVEAADFRKLVRKSCAEMKVSKPNAELAMELMDNALDWGYLRNVSKCVGLEVYFKESLPDGTFVKGYIDRLDLFLPEADVIDLKTQKRAFNDATLSDEWQSKVYNWAARRLYPEITGDIAVSYWVLRHRVQRTWMTEDDAKRSEEELMEVAEEIRSCTEPEPTPSALCPYCPYRAECPASQEGVKSRFKRKNYERKKSGN